MRKEADDNVLVRIGYSRYMLPVAAAHAVQKAMMQAVKLDDAYTSNATIMWIEDTAPVQIELFEDCHIVCDVRSLKGDYRINYKKFFREALDENKGDAEAILSAEEWYAINKE